MKILGIEHLAIAVESIDDSAPFWSHILKIPHRKTEVVESEGVTTDIYLSLIHISEPTRPY